jgi:hypothetical protein
MIRTKDDSKPFQDDKNSPEKNMQESMCNQVQSTNIYSKLGPVDSSRF